jgi:peptidyl-prolyl cis-trans isomerase SurA
MKKLLLICCVSLAVFGVAESFAKATKLTEESLDQIVAVVNDDVVTTSELQQALATAKMQIAQENIPTPADSVLRKQVLDQLINKKLQLQLAKQSGVQVTDSDLNAAIARVASQNHVSVGELYQHLNQEGMSSKDYRAEMRDQLIMHKLQQQEVVSHIAISPQEVDKFMHSQQWQHNSEKEYKLDDILIPISDTPSPEEINAAKVHATMVFTKLNQGQNFQAIAQAESADAKHALQGGDLGWRKLPEVPSAFAEKIVHMKPKEISAPIQTPNGFHIIRLADVRSAGQEAGAPSRKEVENLLLQRKFEEAVQNWVSKLRTRAFISMKSGNENNLA